MTNIGQKIAFSSGEISISSVLSTSPTCTYYIGSSESTSYLLKATKTPTPQFQELHFQEFTNQRLIPPDTHIVSLLDHFSISSPIETHYLKFEYPENGTLKTFMKTHELDQEQIAFIFKDILLAVIKINDSGIVHRDIQPANIWIDKGFNFKLSGFERSMRVDDNRQINLQINSRRLNHPVLRPPDLEETIVMGKVDIWGLGTLLHYLVYREFPFQGDLPPTDVSQELLEVMQHCLQPNPDERPLPRNLLNMISSHKIPVAPFFFKSSNKSVKSLKYSSDFALTSALNLESTSPDLFYLQQLTFNTWAAPDKIPDIYELISNKTLGITLVSIKALIVIHRLLLSGPAEVLHRASRDVLNKIVGIWTNKVQQPGDQFFCEYYCGLNRQLARILIEKVDLHFKFRSVSNWKFSVGKSDYAETVAYLGRIVRVCEGLAMGMDILPKINEFLAMQLMEECQRLMNAIPEAQKSSEIKEFKDRISTLNFEVSAPRPNRFGTAQIGMLVSPKAANPRGDNQRFLLNEKPVLKEDSDLLVHEKPEVMQMSKTDYGFFPKVAEEVKEQNKEVNKEIGEDFADLIDLPKVNNYLPTAGQKKELNGKKGDEAGNGKATLDPLSDLFIFPNLSPSPAVPITNKPAPSAVPFIDKLNPVVSPMLKRPSPGMAPTTKNITPPHLPTIQKAGTPNTAYLARPPSPLRSHPLPIQANLTNKSMTPSIPLTDSHSSTGSPQTQQSLLGNNAVPSQKPMVSINQSPTSLDLHLNPSVPKPRMNSPLPKDAENLKNLLQPQGSTHKKHSSSISSVPDIKPQQTQPNTSKFSIEKRWVVRQSDLKLGPVLGEGASCTVYKGEFKRTPVAIKVMRKSYSGQNIEQEFQREVSAMVTLRHPNLVLFMGASIEPSMLIVSEFCAGGSLFTLLHEKRNILLHWSQKFKMILDIARGMLYLHEATPPILHRDLKSLNMLLADGVAGQNDCILVKVTDFGIARILEESEARMTMRMGTCHWMAPEVISSQPYSLAADVYSFGIVVWEIVARETPYKGINPVEIPMRVLQGDRPDLTLIGPGAPAGIKDLIVSCWDQNPAKRPNFRQVVEFLDKLQGPHDF